MISASIGRKRELICSVSQLPLFQSIRSITFSLGSPPKKLPVTLNEVGLGSHRSRQMLTLASFPIAQTAPSRRIYCADMVLRHAKLGLWPIFASRKDVVGKYLALRSLAKRDPGFFINLHPCFDSIARLKLSISLNPRPPLDFARHIRFQLI